MGEIELLSYTNASRYLGISDCTLRKMVECGYINVHTFINGNKGARFSMKDLEEFKPKVEGLKTAHHSKAKKEMWENIRKKSEVR